MARQYNCPFDNVKFKKIPDLIKYVEKNYKDKIPKEYNGDVAHFLYDDRNGKGKCQICGAPTKWNSKKQRYEILCEPLSIKRLFVDPLRTLRTYFKNKGNSCNEVMRKQFIENATKKDGIFNYAADPEYQKKMLANRKISKVVDFKGKEFTVVGSYEELFLKNLSPLVWSSNDLQAPGPEISWIDDKGNKRLHISDFFLPNYNCVVSIKDGGKDKNNHPSMVARRKDDAYKFKALVDKTKYHVIELNGKEEINNFHKIFKELKQHIKDKKRYIVYPEYYFDYISR